MRFSLLLSSLLFIGCGAATRAARPSRTEAPRTSAPRAQEPPKGLYAADEALRDALSGNLEYLGTGRWPGTNRTQACAFRNGRVFVVNAYCTLTEMQAVRIDVYSPERGHVRIYAEARGPVSARTRSDYFTFTAESEPPPSPTAPVPKLSLAMSFQELRTYDEHRYNAYLPACYGGEELSRRRSGCLGPLASHAREWETRNHSFLEQANADWYRVVREVRALSTQYGREPD
jgi:hypothetical protein